MPSQADWSRLFFDNPVVKTDQAPPPLGWLLEENNQLVGFLGNLIQLYSWEGAVLRAAATTSLVVLPDFAA